jgi:hypothetical protein
MNKIVAIIDHIGRTVVGETVSETEQTLTLKSPVIIHVVPNQQTGQLQVQSFPYMFVEFIDRSSRESNDWTFTKSSIVTSNVVLDTAIISQYRSINTVAPQPTSEPEIIKLFSDD